MTGSENIRVKALVLIAFVGISAAVIALLFTGDKPEPALPPETVNAKPSVEKQRDPEVIRQDIRVAEFNRRNAASRVTELYVEIAKVKKAQRQDNEEVKKLGTQIADKRSVLRMRLDSLPGLLDMKLKRSELVSEERKLLVRRNKLKVPVLKNVASEDERAEFKKIEGRLAVILDEKVALSHEVEDAQELARKGDPQIKYITERIIELTHLQAAKVNQSAPVAALIAKQKEFVGKAAEHLARKNELEAELERAMTMAEAGDGAGAAVQTVMIEERK